MREQETTAYDSKYPNTIVLFPSTALQEQSLYELSDEEIRRREYYPFLEE